MKKEVSLLLKKNQILQETSALLLLRLISGKVNEEELAIDGINTAENQPVEEYNL